jgi:hypothetical protein
MGRMSKGMEWKSIGRTWFVVGDVWNEKGNMPIAKCVKMVKGVCEKDLRLD